jgi:hypothetical protein
MNPWKVLDIPCTSSKKQVKKSYLKKILKHHPDKSKDSNEIFQQLVEAYNKCAFEKSAYTNNNVISIKDLEIVQDHLVYRCNCSTLVVLFQIQENLKDFIYQNLNEIWECDTCSNSFVLNL